MTTPRFNTASALEYIKRRGWAVGDGDMIHAVQILALVASELQDHRIALAESLKLQAHYATLLNMHDGGQRLVLEAPAEWFKRLRAIGALPRVSP